MVDTIYLIIKSHQLLCARWSEYRSQKEDAMDSVLLALGPGVLASLWIAAGLMLTYEVYNMFE
jgi:hypothetical protein